jgi:Derlin-2/3
MPPRVVGVNEPAGPDQWFRSLPIITQYWFGLALVVTLAGNLGVVSPMNFVFNFNAIKDNFQVWRFLTCFLYVGAFEFNTLISIYLLVQFSKQYEKGGPFNTGAVGGTADYAFALLFAMVVMLVTAPVVRRYIIPLSTIFTKNLIYYVLYVWSKRNPEAQANIWGIPIPAIYMPFAYVALTMFMGNPIHFMLHGIAIGHIYYFLVDVIPKVYGKDVLHTPQFLIDFFGVGEYQPQIGQAEPPAPLQRNAGDNAVGGGRHHWGGGGRTLGTQ